MEDTKLIRAAIEAGKTYLGLELGSTRIKAVLMDSRFIPVAEGSHTWENKLIDGVWTYSLDEIWNGVRDCYAKLLSDVERRYGVVLAQSTMGVSGMMHGYMVFGEGNNPVSNLAQYDYRPAAGDLQLFGFNIRNWSIAHLYQAMLNGKTRAGCVYDGAGRLSTEADWPESRRHRRASMFPVCRETGTFDAGMMDSTTGWRSRASASGEHILPRVLMARRTQVR